MSTQRTDPPYSGTEAEITIGFLDYHRDTLRLKTEGLSDEQLRQRLDPSTMTLGGHAQAHGLRRGLVVQPGLRRQPGARAVGVGRLGGRQRLGVALRGPGLGRAAARAPRREHRGSDGSSPQALDADGGLEALSQLRSRRDPSRKFQLRWILAHMLEEYARHNGHADLIRESIDGSVGE